MSRYLKAIFGAVGAALTAILAAYTPRHHIDVASSLEIAIGFVTTLAVIWGVPNTPPKTPTVVVPPEA